MASIEIADSTRLRIVLESHVMIDSSGGQWSALFDEIPCGTLQSLASIPLTALSQSVFVSPTRHFYPPNSRVRLPQTQARSGI
jgi:hypothetical protein